MLVICSCLLGSYKGAGDEKPKYYDIPSFSNDDLPLIPTNVCHGPQQPQPNPEVEIEEDFEKELHLEGIMAEKPQPTNETLVEEPLSAIVEDHLPDEETLVKQPQQSELELQDPSTIGLCDPDLNNLYTCTEILGSESCNNMVTEMSEVVTERSWSRKREKEKALNKERLANMWFPPLIPRYIGRPCQFMKIKRRDGKITMSLVQMDRQPEQMHIEREDGHIKMQLMTYVGDGMNNDAEASTSASTSQQVLETYDQCGNNKEVEVVTDKCNSNEEAKKLVTT